MKLLLTIISFSLLLSQQLQVDGNLKVTGEIDAQGQAIKNVGTPQAVTDALNLQTLNNMMTDDTQYEYLAYKVYIPTNAESTEMNWIQIGIDGLSSNSWNNYFVLELNSKANEGYQIHSMMNLPWITYFDGDQFSGAVEHTSSASYTLFILRRPLEQE